MIAAIAPACARPILEARHAARAHGSACVHTCRERRWRRTGDRITSLLAQAVTRVRCAGFSHELVRQLDQCSGAPHDALCSDPSGRGRRREQRIPRRRVRLRRPCCDGQRHYWTLSETLIALIGTLSALIGTPSAIIGSLMQCLPRRRVRRSVARRCAPQAARTTGRSSRAT